MFSTDCKKSPDLIALSAMDRRLVQLSLELHIFMGLPVHFYGLHQMDTQNKFK